MGQLVTEASLHCQNLNIPLSSLSDWYSVSLQHPTHFFLISVKIYYTQEQLSTQQTLKKIVYRCL